MPDDGAISDAISTNAQGPQSASGDAGSVSQHSLSDQIAADKYLRGKDAASSPTRGLRFSSLKPPGAV